MSLANLANLACKGPKDLFYQDIYDIGTLRNRLKYYKWCINLLITKYISNLEIQMQNHLFNS